MSKENLDHILENEVLTAQEVAAYLRVSRVTAWRWCQQGIIPAYRVGRTWRIHRDDLLEMLGRTQPPEPAQPLASMSLPEPRSTPEVPLTEPEKR